MQKKDPHPSLQPSFRNPKFLFTLLTLITGGILLAPYITFQPYLSQGDHGRELYCAQQILRGDVPYRDFYWNYGPLPLYYYALCFKIFGVSINSVLAGRALLNLMAGLFIFQALALLIPFEFAYLAAMWFWFFNPDFHHTYCYTAGFTALTGLIYALFLYLHTPRTKYLLASFVLLFVLFFIKINIGGVALLGFLISLALIDLSRKKSWQRTDIKKYILAGVGLPLLVFLVYLAFVYTSPLYVITQCFPFLPHPAMQTSSTHTFSTPSAIFWWLKAQFLTMRQSGNNLIMAFILFLAFGLTVAWWRRKNSDAAQVSRTLIAGLILILYYFLNLIEFLLSGIPYRTAWAQPFAFLLLFLFLGLGLRQVNRALQIVLILALGAGVVSQHTFYLKRMKGFEDSGKIFTSSRGRVICANGPAWNETVTQATRYLKEHLAASETFYALPYESLYYFLTAKTAPSRQYTIYTPYAFIPSELEGQIIADLTDHNVNYILISNRYRSSEFDYGQLGVTYCPLLMRYIEQHFREVATFGDWDAPAEWVKNHAVKILKRI